MKTMPFALAGLASVLIIGCASDPGSQSNNATASSYRDKTLDPQVALVDAPDMGASFADIAARELAGLALTHEYEGQGCVGKTYKGNGRELDHEVCEDRQILREYVDNDNMADKAFADHDNDGYVDAIRDDPAGWSMRDENHDRTLDWYAQDLETLPSDFVIEGYGEGWELREQGKRILEDTDFDGQFDRESVTGWWVRP